MKNNLKTPGIRPARMLSVVLSLLLLFVTRASSQINLPSPADTQLFKSLLASRLLNPESHNQPIASISIPHHLSFGLSMYPSQHRYQPVDISSDTSKPVSIWNFGKSVAIDWQKFNCNYNRPALCLDIYTPNPEGNRYTYIQLPKPSRNVQTPTTKKPKQQIRSAKSNSPRSAKAGKTVSYTRATKTSQTTRTVAYNSPTRKTTSCKLASKPSSNKQSNPSARYTKDKGTLRNRFFISYAKADKRFARYLQNKLEQLGYFSWIDEDFLEAGIDWRDNIDKTLKKALAVIVVMSPSAKKSDYVMYEWTFALVKKIRIIPVMLKKNAMHPRLEVLQHLDFTGNSKPWNKLATILSKLNKYKKTVRKYYC